MKKTKKTSHNRISHAIVALGLKDESRKYTEEELMLVAVFAGVSLRTVYRFLSETTASGETT